MNRSREGAVRAGFGADLLDLLAELAEVEGDEDPTEAEAAGCRKVAELGDHWGLFRTWDEPREGDRPVALFTERRAARLASAVWIAQARAPLLRLDPQATAEGFRIWPACEMVDGAVTAPIGWLESFNPPLAAALDLAAALVRDPEALAVLLEVAGVPAVEQVLRILRRRHEILFGQGLEDRHSRPDDSRDDVDVALLDALLSELRESEGDEDPTEAEAAGCRKVLAVGSRWGLFREWDDPRERARPVALFTERWAAVLASAVWVPRGRSPLLRLDPQATPEGFRIWPASGTAGEGVELRPVGWLPSFNPPLAAALEVAAALVRDPEALAALLEAAGVEAVEQVIRILRRRVRDRPADAEG